MLILRYYCLNMRVHKQNRDLPEFARMTDQTLGERIY